MSIESPKFKIVIREKQKERLTARQKLKKEIREIAAWGFITLSALGITKVLFPEKPKEISADHIISVHINKDKTIKEVEKQELLKKFDYLRQQFGDSNLGRLTHFSEINRDVKSKNPEIKGFNKLHPKLNDEILQNVWSEKYYPNGWINERVSAVEYSEEKGELSDQTGLDPKTWKALAEYSAPETKKAKITFFRAAGSLVEDDASVQQVILALNAHFSHELGHANDWKEEDMSFKNRIEFLYEVAQQCFQEGSMDSEYVKSIKNDNPQVERYCKVIEYWAEICECYFSWPHMLETAHPDAFALVDKYVKKEDPRFNIIEKNDEILKAIKNIVEK